MIEPVCEEDGDLTMGTGTASKKAQGNGAQRVSSAAQQRKPKALSDPLITGEPIELPLENVEEDPDQPRQTFGEAAMQELADSIATHGVKVPISVHRHPKLEGRYIINDGARRYRATLRAGLATVPAVVTDAFSLIEQIVVNKVRDDTPAKDKAQAFARLMKTKGWSQRELAQASRLSEAYVSQHLVLLNLPELLDELFESGRCTDVTLVNELLKAYKKGPGEVEAWLSNEDQEITRGSVKVLRSFLGNKRAMQQEGREREDGSDPQELQGESATPDADDVDPDDEEQDDEASAPTSGDEEVRTRASDKIGRILILGTYERRAVRLITNRRWSAEGLCWARFEDTGEEAEIELARLRIKRFVEA
ncbi:MAG: ParB/RepB/Spo0J family partition protein [Proteobacteria bacterium]|nr:MAG: ParB/RepB/Spo0J family partition protein [Pseudomonadota bacterium]